MSTPKAADVGHFLPRILQYLGIWHRRAQGRLEFLHVAKEGLLASCNDDTAAFRITSVDVPDSVQSDGARGTLIVDRTGSASFPLRRRDKSNAHRAASARVPAVFFG